MRFDAKQLKKMSDTVRAVALRAIAHARSGHVGIVLGASDIITTIYANFLRRGRDKFVLSAGHGGAMLYSVLHLAGYKIADIESFRKIGGLAGHPEIGIDGVCATTGPLGQGVGNAVGLALAQKIQKSDGRVYCLCSDGDLMEGVAQESIAFAGRYKLDNLVLLWDDNKISIDGVALTDIDMAGRMRSAGWHVIAVNGNSCAALDDALVAAAKFKKPVFIQCRTTIGRGSSVAGMACAHGLGIKIDELLSLADRLESNAGLELWGVVASDACARYVQNPLDVSVNNVIVPDSPSEISTRELSGLYLDSLIRSGVRLIGGSADLSASTNVRTAGHHDIAAGEFSGNFINYGVREHAMGAIMNGLAAAGLRPYGSTFLAFSDYLRPAIRLAALSELPVTYVFTHDSIAVGEDGPTHQPIEQLPSLRLIPNLYVWRPCNMAEVAAAWNYALRADTYPTAIILSRQKFVQVKTPRGANPERGAYIIRPTKGAVDITIIATGAEVPLALTVARKLGDNVQVVSMPCVELFRAQDDAYQQKILRGYVISIEASASAAWFEFADAVVGINEFGVSGDGAAVYSALGFDTDSIVAAISAEMKH